MSFFTWKVKLPLVFSVVLVTGVLAVVNFTDACRLETVILNGKQIDDWQDRFSELRETSIFKQSLDDFARHLLSQRGVFKVDVSYTWPRTLNIKTNAFAPSCLIVDKVSGDMYGVDREGRLLPLDKGRLNWECPILTGVTAKGLFNYCDDVRVEVVVEQLEQLRSTQPDFFWLLNEIDFGAPDHLEVFVAGLTYRLKVRAERFLDDLNRFADFISRFNPDLDSVRQIDLRFDDMILCVRGKS
ncbi:MAG: cell division protein FtsQ/DivIB [Candidatus Zixiibacteriota bacterium]